MKAFFLFVMSLFLFCGCSSKNDNQHKREIGKYVYLDSDHVLHIRKPCTGMRTTDKDGISSFKSVEFIDTLNINQEVISNLCPWCIKDAHYEKLNKMAHRKSRGLGWGINSSQTDW